MLVSKSLIEGAEVEVSRSVSEKKIPERFKPTKFEAIYRQECEHAVNAFRLLHICNILLTGSLTMHQTSKIFEADFYRYIESS